MRYFALLILALSPGLALAQGGTSVQPLVTIEVPEDATIVGQPAIVRLKVLVPTYMPAPPIFPSLEQENLLVRLPERASGPISETIEGETWSGVQSSFRVYPMTAGTFNFDPSQVWVTFADPDTNDPIQMDAPLPPVSLTATIPEAASGLNPLIIASSFELQQKVEGNVELGAGDAITRSVTASIGGTSPIIIPPLLPAPDDRLLKGYPKEPRFIETEDRGVLSGQRTDQTTYVAQDGGQSQLPEIALDWFNLETGKVETARVEPVQLILTAPPWQFPDRETILRAGALIAILFALLTIIFRKLRPTFEVKLLERRRRYRASPEYAYKALKQAVNEKDLARIYTTLDDWKRRTPVRAETAEFEAKLAEIGASRFGNSHKPAQADWAGLRSCLKQLDQPIEAFRRGLPPLNP